MPEVSANRQIFIKHFRLRYRLNVNTLNLIPIKIQRFRDPVKALLFRYGGQTSSGFAPVQGFPGQVCDRRLKDWFFDQMDAE